MEPKLTKPLTPARARARGRGLRRRRRALPRPRDRGHRELGRGGGDGHHEDGLRRRLEGRSDVCTCVLDRSGPEPVARALIQYVIAD